MSQADATVHLSVLPKIFVSAGEASECDGTGRTGLRVEHIAV